ncbi:hypothetical protein GPECTOR_45g129 [Gonium pectorale]|uniref:Uncharacterized protein n=1 Tax=Gonium pectorale TaxID=33097 RepID=A0A150G8S6_GONPE|nr:hypothetical protein GPECTOR_45g129 [Gonium pectorale]|eukprot:KXZ46259.1 hypothetical protein GPECTOR_45g129 [Gonium pectorale]
MQASDASTAAAMLTISRDASVPAIVTDAGELKPYFPGASYLRVSSYSVSLDVRIVTSPDSSAPEATCSPALLAQLEAALLNQPAIADLRAAVAARCAPGQPQPQPQPVPQPVPQLEHEPEQSGDPSMRLRVLRRRRRRRRRALLAVATAAAAGGGACASGAAEAGAATAASLALKVPAVGGIGGIGGGAGSLVSQVYDSVLQLQSSGVGGATVCAPPSLSDVSVATEVMATYNVPLSSLGVQSYTASCTAADDSSCAVVPVPVAQGGAPSGSQAPASSSAPSPAGQSGGGGGSLAVIIGVVAAVAGVVAASLAVVGAVTRRRRALLVADLVQALRNPSYIHVYDGTAGGHLLQEAAVERAVKRHRQQRQRWRQRQHRLGPSAPGDADYGSGDGSGEAGEHTRDRDGSFYNPSELPGTAEGPEAEAEAVAGAAGRGPLPLPPRPTSASLQATFPDSDEEKSSEDQFRSDQLDADSASASASDSMISLDADDEWSDGPGGAVTPFAAAATTAAIISSSGPSLTRTSRPLAEAADGSWVGGPALSHPVLRREISPRSLVLVKGSAWGPAVATAAASGASSAASAAPSGRQVPSRLRSALKRTATVAGLATGRGAGKVAAAPLDVAAVAAAAAGDSSSAAVRPGSLPYMFTDVKVGYDVDGDDSDDDDGGGASGPPDAIEGPCLLFRVRWRDGGAAAATVAIGRPEWVPLHRSRRLGAAGGAASSSAALRAFLASRCWRAFKRTEEFREFAAEWRQRLPRLVTIQTGSDTTDS